MCYFNFFFKEYFILFFPIETFSPSSLKNTLVFSKPVTRVSSQNIQALQKQISFSSKSKISFSIALSQQPNIYCFQNHVITLDRYSLSFTLKSATFFYDLRRCTLSELNRLSLIWVFFDLGIFSVFLFASTSISDSRETITPKIHPSIFNHSSGLHHQSYSRPRHHCCVAPFLPIFSGEDVSADKGSGG
uniref:Uncharacterized protein LOC101500112 isoform X2 n=1 Tax=Cicer arietinum TaxID=3827 RepID=A0A3Q7XST1_CICAR|nr:uncharacterized protein LOC101500112 isoform X2 [Cicer arietinum]